MKRAGFSYDRYKKNYYVDNHDDKKVVAYREEYLKEWAALQYNMAVWYQVPFSELKRAYDSTLTESTVAMAKASPRCLVESGDRERTRGREREAHPR